MCSYPRCCGAGLQVCRAPKSCSLWWVWRWAWGNRTAVCQQPSHPPLPQSDRSYHWHCQDSKSCKRTPKYKTLHSRPRSWKCGSPSRWEESGHPVSGWTFLLQLPQTAHKPELPVSAEPSAKAQLLKPKHVSAELYFFQHCFPTHLLVCNPAVNQVKHGILMLQIQLTQQRLDGQSSHFLTGCRIIVQHGQWQRHKEQTAVLLQVILWTKNRLILQYHEQQEKNNAKHFQVKPKKGRMGPSFIQQDFTGSCQNRARFWALGLTN